MVLILPERRPLREPYWARGNQRSPTIVGAYRLSQTVSLCLRAMLRRCTFVQATNTALPTVVSHSLVNYKSHVSDCLHCSVGSTCCSLNISYVLQLGLSISSCAHKNRHTPKCPSSRVSSFTNSLSDYFVIASGMFADDALLIPDEDPANRIFVAWSFFLVLSFAIWIYITRLILVEIQVTCTYFARPITGVKLLLWPRVVKKTWLARYFQWSLRDLFCSIGVRRVNFSW